MMGKRPLSLVVVDEAQKIESENGGMKLEFLLATVRRNCTKAKYLLMTHDAKAAEPMAKWLTDDPLSVQTVSFDSSIWKPTERIIGKFSAVADRKHEKKWNLELEPMSANGSSLLQKGKFQVGDTQPLGVSKGKVLRAGKQAGLAIQTAAMAKEMSANGVSIAIGSTIPEVWEMASNIFKDFPAFNEVSEEIGLLQEFLRMELGPDLKLIEWLDRRVGVYHAGLPDDVLTLIEWLTETGKFRVLCSTMSNAQNLNFPVASIFLQSQEFSNGEILSSRDFWNLADRAGRIGQDKLGIIGVAKGNDSNPLKKLISRSPEMIVSQLVSQLEQIESQGELDNLYDILWNEQWEDFRCFIAHLWAKSKKTDVVVSEVEQFLKQTFGYRTIHNSRAHKYKAVALLGATHEYVKHLSKLPPFIVQLAETTGFSPEVAKSMLSSVQEVKTKFNYRDWSAKKLFSNENSLVELYDVMLNIPQLNQPLETLVGNCSEVKQLAEVTIDWVNGTRIDRIANKHFADGEREMDGTELITRACQVIHGAIVNGSSRGIYALSQYAGMNFEGLSESERNSINLLPAMVYHGVNTEEAVLMRMNSIPRSFAVSLGKLFRRKSKGNGTHSVGDARNFLKSLSDKE